VNDILLKYQKEVERTIPRALEQGVKGWEVSDLKITLIGGEDHVVHSRAGDFVIATPMAIMNGLKAIGTVLLEPIMKFTIQGPEDILGQVTSDLLKMRGVFDQPELDEGKMKLKGKLPVATSLEYPVKLASRTGGRASIQMQFDSYQKVEDDLGEIREFKGISPLDRAKYILKARKAIQ
jgi:ribosomal protection tetracycline resistance protein